MIHVNDRFTIDSDASAWQVRERFVGTSRKTGEPLERWKTTYWPSLLHCCRHIIDRSATTADSLDAVVAAIEAAHNDLATTTAGPSAGER